VRHVAPPLASGETSLGATGTEAHADHHCPSCVLSRRASDRPSTSHSLQPAPRAAIAIPVSLVAPRASAVAVYRLAPKHSPPIA
jgi:hypothetical protein